MAVGESFVKPRSSSTPCSGTVAEFVRAVKRVLNQSPVIAKNVNDVR